MTAAGPLPSPPPVPAPDAPRKCPVVIEFTIEGDLRFLAHHDELRLLARALVRAGWPLAYSRGFNPRPRLTVPLPRNLGTGAACQVALTELCEPRPADELSQSLARQLPAGCRLLRVVAPAPRATPHPRRATYELDLETDDVPGLEARLDRLQALPELTVQRDGGPFKRPHPIDIRPYIERLELDGQRLRLALRFVEQRTARPSEVITELGLAPHKYQHRLWRVDVQWDLELARPTEGDTAQERNGIGNEEDNPQEGNEALP